MRSPDLCGDRPSSLRLIRVADERLTNQSAWTAIAEMRHAQECHKKVAATLAAASLVARSGPGTGTSSLGASYPTPEGAADRMKDAYLRPGEHCLRRCFRGAAPPARTSAEPDVRSAAGGEWEQLAKQIQSLRRDHCKQPLTAKSSWQFVSDSSQEDAANSLQGGSSQKLASGSSWQCEIDPLRKESAAALQSEDLLDEAATRKDGGCLSDSAREVGNDGSLPRIENDISVHSRSTFLIRKVLGPDHDSSLWKERVAQARSTRPLIVLLQMFLRKQEAQGSPESPLLELLPTPQKYDKLQARIGKTSDSNKDLEYYVCVLEAASEDEQCRLFLKTAREKAVPPFLFTYILRRDASFVDLKNLRELIDLCSREIHLPCTKGSERRAGKAASASHPNHVTRQSLTLIRLLAWHSYRLEPRYLVLVANVARQLMQWLGAQSIGSKRMFLLQCDLFNRLLCVFQPLPKLHPSQRFSPNAYLWEAQRLVLAMSTTLEKPLMVDRDGFRAIREVLAGQAKNKVEAHNLARHASTWPPYLQASDGVEEKMEPQESWSRAVSGGMLMQEAGFAKEEADVALDVLSGTSEDGTPSIQQRVLVGHGSNRLRVWDASIRATRNAREAWQNFQTPPVPGARPGLAEYAAMFHKLVLREAEVNSEWLAGEKALNFPTQQEANLRKIEVARQEAPSVEQLYRQMQRNGLRPRGHCLRLLVATAETLGMAHRYLEESAECGSVVRCLTADEPDPELLRGVPMKLFLAYVKACLPKGGKKSRAHGARALRLALVRLKGEKCAISLHIWGLLLKSFSRRHEALGVGWCEQLDMLSDLWARIEGDHGINLSNAVQFAKSVRKVTRRQLEGPASDLEGAPTAERHPILTLYVGSDADDKLSLVEDSSTSASRTGTGGWHRARSLQRAAARVKSIFKALMEQEMDIQANLTTPEVKILDRMASRKDAVRNEHAYEYMLCLAFLGEFAEMARFLGWLMRQWGQKEVVDALEEADEVPRYADLHETLCVFRLFAEPMVPRSVVEALRRDLTLLDSIWRWPDDEAVTLFRETHEDASLDWLASLLERMQGGREGEWERAGAVPPCSGGASENDA